MSYEKELIENQLREKIRIGARIGDYCVLVSLVIESPLPKMGILRSTKDLPNIYTFENVFITTQALMELLPRIQDPSKISLQLATHREWAVGNTISLAELTEIKD